MKKRIFFIGFFLAVLSFLWFDYPRSTDSQNLLGLTTVLKSFQTGTSPVNGSVLQTDGTNSAWVATSTLGITGGASLSGGSLDALTYWTSGTTVGATTSPTVGTITATSTTATSTFAGGVSFTGYQSGLTEILAFALSDETTALTTSSSTMTFRMPYAATLAGIRANVVTAPTGSTIIVNVKESGTTIFSTRLSIDATETTSVTAATPAVFSDTSLADDAQITVEIDQVGSTVAGTALKVNMYLKRQ